MLPDMIHLLIVVAVVTIMASFAMLIIVGYRSAQASTLSESLFTYFKYFTTTDDSKLFKDLTVSGLDISSLEFVLIKFMWIFSALTFIFMLRSFFIVVIMVSFSEALAQHHHQP